MQIASLEIENFRGISAGTVNFSKHTVLIGPNNCGKTTVIEALALLFGRDRMIRSLTEHDFYGSNPDAIARIKLVATVIGFEGDDPSQHLDWFRDDRGIVKWWNPKTKKVEPERSEPECKLACQIAFAARFDRPSLEVETIRYFYDDDEMGDVFNDELSTTFPARLIREVGFFLVPATRTWDRMVSFGSELFRRVVAASNGQPSESVIAERDRLRDPQGKLEKDDHLGPIVDELNKELEGFFRTTPTLQLRVTATDSSSLLDAVVTHYTHQGTTLPLPARRHGSGLLSLQHLLLLLQFGRMRSENNEGFWMALEEPELHVPPALQRRLVHRIQALSTQTFVTTHSPMIASLADPTGVIVLRNEGGVLSSRPLLSSALPADTTNGVRKLFQVNRAETVAALMHDFVLIPEGRTDYEWLMLLVRAADLHQGWTDERVCHFDSFIGVIPTHDSAVVKSVEILQPLHPRVLALVDGDDAGVGYAKELLAQDDPNSGVIVRWPDDWTLENVIGWIVEADADECLAAVTIDPPAASVPELVERLKSKDRPVYGLKADTSAYEAIADAISARPKCYGRAKQVLDAIADAAQGIENAMIANDPNLPALKVFKP